VESLGVGRDLHDPEREHAGQGDALSERDLDVEEIFGWPEEDYKVADCVLAGMEIIDRLDVEAFCGSDVLEDLPVRARGSVHCLSVSRMEKSLNVVLRALEQCEKEAGHI
jgi:hypothetical protein